MDNALQILEVVTNTQGDRSARARAIITNTRGWSEEALTNLFEVALGSGLLSQAEATFLLQALTQICATGDPLVNFEEPVELRRTRQEVTALQQRRLELESQQTQVASWQTAARQLEQTIHSQRQKLSSLGDAASQLEEERTRLENVMKEVKS